MQNENKPLSGRGGARPGAGRPTGTTKENKKKPCSFKLSESEEQTTRKVLSDMRNDDIFKFEEQIRLMDGLKPLIVELQKKYGETLSISIYPFDVLIRVDKTLKDKANIIIEEFIQWAKENLEEEYSLPLINPMMIWSLLSKEDITYSWLLERKLKEDKENSSLA